ncbi:MAG TPA: DNA polymerase III subunit delta [Verrucomicrobiae bacterium]|nr:DNA polymerase III subunit delta [Verrucomicrobiae bacterium]
MSDAPPSSAKSTAMPPATPQPLPVLICGDDEFAVKERARKIYQDWCGELGGMDHEVIDAGVSNSGDALTAIGRLREALQTLPFFGSGKAIWFRDCNFLGDERAASTAAVTEALNDLAAELKGFVWQSVRLLISAGKVDKRKTFYKTIDKIGAVETFSAWSAEDKDWMERAEMAARSLLRERKKEISEPALAELIARVGPNPRQLAGETEKLCLFAAARPKIELGDVEAVCSRNKTARAFALGDALGDRNLAQLMRCLDEELWEMKFDSQKSEIGLLYGLISKVRVMLLLKEMVREGWVKAEADYSRFKSQLERVPENAFPADKKFNPLAMHPWMLHRALGQSKNYSRAELVRAMGLLLDCNRKLVSSGLDEALVLQQMLVQVVAPQQAVAA